MSLIIREVLFSECNILADISRSTFFETFVEYNTSEDMDQYLAEHCVTSKIEAEMMEENTLFFFAEYNKDIIGFVKLKLNKVLEKFSNAKSIEIERLYVSQTHHSLKIGASLMAHCIDIAQKGDYEIIFLAVWEHNHKAIKFYEKWGYVPFGSHIFLLGTDKQNDILMKRDL